MRFSAEVTAALRQALNQDFAFGVGSNVEDRTPSGRMKAEMPLMAQHFVTAGSLDFLSTLAGTRFDAGLSVIVGDFGYRPCYLAANARPLKHLLPGLPIFTVGRITTSNLAEQIVLSGAADMVAMTRAIIAGPQWAAKAQAGDSHRIRPCIACNTCLQMNRAVTPITCAVYPTCSEEPEYGAAQHRPAPHAAVVLVVGGGVAGREAARSAAERGQRVSLFEKEHEIGGQVGMLARTKTCAEMQRLTDYFRTELTIFMWRSGSAARSPQTRRNAARRATSCSRQVRAACPPPTRRSSGPLRPSPLRS